MTQSENANVNTPSLDEVQRGWHDLLLRVGQLEAERVALEKENKSLRFLLERVIEHRQKSHTELVLILAGLASKLNIQDIGGIVSRLVEHNTHVGQYLAALGKGTTDAILPEPAILRTLDQAKRDLLAAIKSASDELLRLDTPIETALLESLAQEPEQFYSPRAVRARRCFVKGQVARERVLREFGEPALVFFSDMTTDPKLNPRPKPEEIVLGFKNDFESLFQSNPGVVAEQRQQLRVLYDRVQQSKANSEQARLQKAAFQRLSFYIELLHFYEHQNTEPVDLFFAQRLPALVEQLVLAGHDQLDEKMIALAENLLAMVINPDHRHMIVNNLGKGDETGKTLKFVLRLRPESVTDADQVVHEFVRHLVPARSAAPPSADAIAPVLRLIHPDMQRYVTKSIMVCDRLRKPDAEALGKAIATQLGLKSLAEEIKHQATLTPEVERQMAWSKIKELILSRTEAAVVAAAIRERLHAKYDVDEIRQSWITLTEADPMSLIRIFCQIPYLPTGKTDPIARPVMETYITRLTHEKYAPTYHKIVNSLKNVFRTRPDSPALVNFLTLVNWIDAQAASRISSDIGMATPAH